MEIRDKCIFIAKVNLKKVLIILSTIICGCTSSSKHETDTFIVPVDTMPVYKPVANQPPPPPPVKAYYFPSNFIVDTAEGIFFYQQQQNERYCGTGIEWNTPPLFIGLMPKDIFQIPVENIGAFIKLNILNRDSLDRYVSVASTQDTIKSAGLAKILTLFEDKSNHIRWILRKVTQEEAIVLDYKIRRANYNSDKIKWDSAKIQFPLPYRIEL